MQAIWKLQSMYFSFRTWSELISTESERAAGRQPKLKYLMEFLKRPLDAQSDCAINRLMVAPKQSIWLYNNFDCANFVSCRGNIGSCAICCAIMTIDVQSYCTNSQCSPLYMTRFLIPIYLVSYILPSFWWIYIYMYIYKCVIDFLYTTFIYFISFFHLDAFVNYFFIALCVSSSQLYFFLNILLIWSLFGIFFHFIGRSFYLFSFL